MKGMRKTLLRTENLAFLGALLGLAAGIFLPQLSIELSLLGDIFLQLLRMMIIPLIFVSVFLAVAKQAGRHELSRVGLRTVLYFASTSALACLTGLLAAHLFLNAPTALPEYAAYDSGKLGALSFSQAVLGFIPGNPFQALAKGEIIQIVFFSLLSGVACTGIAPEKKKPLIAGFDAAHDLVMVAIGWILYLAPVGIFSLVATVVAKTDAKSFAGLGWLFSATGFAMVVHALLTLPAIGFLLGRFHPYRFLLNVKEALVVALATASSSATLPVSTRVLEENEKVRPETTGFVLPLGATLNMDGSALYQSIVVIFLGGLAGIDFTFGQQLMIFIMVMLSSAGTAGIPGGGIVMMGMILQTVGVPLELIGIYLLVDRFWDPPVTMVNVMGDLFGAKVVDRWR